MTDTITYKTMRCVSPLRFVDRDGKRILQHPIEHLETGKIEWVDVPLVEEEQAKAAIEAYERVQPMNICDNHVQKQAENEHVRKMTVSEVADYIVNSGDTQTHLMAKRVARELAKLGTIRIVGEV